MARSQVVKGCLSISEVAEKYDEAAGAKAGVAADLDTLALTPRMRKAGVEKRISNLESEILILREQVEVLIPVPVYQYLSAKRV